MDTTTVDYRNRYSNQSVVTLGSHTSNAMMKPAIEIKLAMESDRKPMWMTHGDIIEAMTQFDKHLKALAHKMLTLETRSRLLGGALSLHTHASAGCLASRWRWRIGKRNHVEPCETPEGQRYLRQQSQQYWTIFEPIEQERIELNHQYSVIFHERKRLRLVVEKRRQLKALKNQITTNQQGVNHAVRL